ncbi:hypothetical protein [Flammeovirga sp. EKP202]|uniref:hypothetical protein n=1 Tax=Flammeovirga sp. EKP202 TaxID=2770592 RepID=UPI00165ECC9C|nr:hypothetical protein [Flammeovirga sp. EKP202]MBD0400141.1 hypothetical protein [Flammeovirga sp. EKP202]
MKYIFSKTLLAIVFCALFSLRSNAQGCADAGLCSIGPMKSSEFFNETPTHGELRFRPSYGLGEKQVSVIGLQLEGDYNIKDVVYFQFQLPYIITTGGLGNANGFGDLTLSLSVPVYKGDEVTTTIFGGTKIPFQDGNVLYNGAPLPMAYQPSLGTYDILGGVAVRYKQFLFSAGYQQPLTQNENAFFETGSDPDNESWSTNQFERQADLAIRAEYSKENPDKINWKAGLLGIVHMGNDSFVDTDGVRKEIDGSSGLTLNLTGGISKAFGDYTLGADLGFPVMARTARPDGLTRSFVIGFYGGWKF